MQLNEVTRKAGFEKGWEKGKKRGAGNALLFPFPFQISLPPTPLLPLPFFVPATQAIYFEVGAAEGSEHRYPNFGI